MNNEHVFVGNRSIHEMMEELLRDLIKYGEKDFLELGSESKSEFKAI
ncbi:hypothetical protein [Peribacillus loiseleuriae]